MGFRRFAFAVLAAIMTAGGFAGTLSAQDTSSSSTTALSAAGFRANAARTGFVDENGPKGPPSILWRAPIKGAQTASTENGFVAIHGQDGVSLFDAQTGELKWQASQEPSGSAPVIAGDAVYAGSAGGFHAYDLATGEVRWTYLNGMEGDPNGPPIDVYDSSPAYVDGTIYVGSGPYPHTGVIALDAATGALRWRFDTKGGAPGSPAVADGVVYIGSETCCGMPGAERPAKLFAIDAGTGTQIWAAPFKPNDTIFSTPAVANGVVIAGTTDPDNNTGTWHGVDTKTGADKWTLDTTGGIWWTGAAIADGVAFLTDPDANAIVAVDLQTGQEQWRQDVGGGVYTSVTVSRDAVYVPVAGGNLVALDRTTGKQVWSLDMGADGNSVTVANGKLYLERGGMFFALTDAGDPLALALAAPPTEPLSGPGAPPTAYPAARVTHYGDEPGGFWIVEPALAADNASPVATTPLPVILYLSGCCGNGNYPTPEEVQPWLEHLARTGFIVIAPVYNSASAIPNAVKLIKDAMEELKHPGHAAPDYDKFGIIGYSFGGSMAVDLAGQAIDRGLPVPDAIFIDAPCETIVFTDCVPLAANLDLPADLKAVVLVFSDDIVVGDAGAKVLWGALAALPAENRDYITMTTDTHGNPSIVAAHETTYQNIDAADWHGLWKLSTALFTCAFSGEDCEYALGNTPEQTSMGAWSDGTPVTPLIVTDDPGPAEGAEPEASPEATPAN